MNLKDLEKMYEKEVVVQNPKAIFQEMQDIKDWQKEGFRCLLPVDKEPNHISGDHWDRDVEFGHRGAA